MDIIEQRPVVGEERIRELMRALQQYKAGKAKTDTRIIESEQWWKLRNTEQESKRSEVMASGDFKSVSGWLHNVITSKHADAMESYPEPNVLPREPGDEEEAKTLSNILPCVMEQNDFEQVYSDAMWQKLKTGTACYKVVWDAGKLHGLGDISVHRVNLLDIYWQPGVTDIQKSRYFFHTELLDKEVLEEAYPEIKDKLKGNSFLAAKFLYDDSVSTENKYTVVECYYKKLQQGRRVLHYLKFVGDTVLYATENEPEMAERGLYDHGLYPYVLDALFPIEGSPCGYGYVDLCRNPQTEIDLLKTSFLKNAVAGATPRYFARQDGAVNEEEFLDLTKPLVHTAGNLGEDSLRRIETNNLDGIYVTVMDRTIEELRQTSGNTETSTGAAPSGVTAASAIAALQEASGKGSRDSTMATYRAYREIVGLCIELIRQFYDAPRKFRILGDLGQQEFITYSNQSLKPSSNGMAFGMDMGMRMPVFDIKVSAQKQNVYTKVSQNELALQFFQLGFFSPQMTDTALLCLKMMDFAGKDKIMQSIAEQGTMAQKLQQYLQLVLQLAQATGNPQLYQMAAMDAQSMGVQMPKVGGARVSLQGADQLGSLKQEEHSIVQKARERSNNATQPG